jgi:hypothetical protein
VDPFWEAAVSLQPGEISGVVESPYGFHVLLLDERRPVPFEEANRTSLLERVVPREQASAAMEEWAARNAAVLLDPPAVRTARERLLAGSALPADLQIATGATGGEYTGAHLVAGWGLLQPEERLNLERADEGAFARWLEGEAREVIWAEQAGTMGVAAPVEARPAADLAWQRRVVRWAQAFGFRPGMTGEQVVAAAMQGLLSGAADPRAARAEIRSLRPRLRELYPVATPEAF